MGALENECQISQNYILHMKFFKILPVFSQLYYYLRNFCNLIGSEQWCFSLI